MRFKDRIINLINNNYIRNIVIALIGMLVPKIAGIMYSIIVYVINKKSGKNKHSFIDILTELLKLNPGWGVILSQVLIFLNEDVIENKENPDYKLDEYKNVINLLENKLELQIDKINSEKKKNEIKLNSKDKIIIKLLQKNKEKNKQLIDIYHNLLKTKRDNIDIYINLSNIYLEQLDILKKLGEDSCIVYNKSIIICEEALNIDPDNKDILNIISQIYKSSDTIKGYKKAIEYYNHILEIYADNKYEVYLLIAEAYFNLSKLQSKEESFRSITISIYYCDEIEKLYQDKEELYLLKHDIFVYLIEFRLNSRFTETYEKLITCMDKLIELKPENIDMYMKRCAYISGLVNNYLFEEKYEEAREYCNNTIITLRGMIPKYEDEYRVYQRLGEMYDLLGDIEKKINNDNNNKESNLQYKIAKENFSMLLNFELDIKSKGYRNMALMSLKLGKLQDALDEFEIARDKGYDDICEINLMISQIYIQLSRLDESINLLKESERKAKRENDNNSLYKIYFILGEIYLEKYHMYNEAIKYHTMAINTYKYEYHSYLRRAEAYRLLGKNNYYDRDIIKYNELKEKYKYLSHNLSFKRGMDLF